VAKDSSCSGCSHPGCRSSAAGVEGGAECRLLWRSASMKMKPWREGFGMGVEARYWSMECWAWRGCEGGHQARVGRALEG